MAIYNKIPVSLSSTATEYDPSEPKYDTTYKNWFGLEKADIEFWKQPAPEPMPAPTLELIPAPTSEPIPAPTLITSKKPNKKPNKQSKHRVVTKRRKTTADKVINFRDHVELDPGTLRVQPCMYMESCTLGDYCTFSHVKWYDKTCSICGIFTNDYNRHKSEHRHIAALSTELANILNK